MLRLTDTSLRFGSACGLHYFASLKKPRIPRLNVSSSARSKTYFSYPQKKHVIDLLVFSRVSDTVIAVPKREADDL